MDVALGLLTEHARARTADGAIDGETAFEHAQLCALAGQFEDAALRLRSAAMAGFVCRRYMEIDDPLMKMPAPELQAVLQYVAEAESTLLEELGRGSLAIVTENSGNR